MNHLDEYLPTLGPLVRRTTFSMAKIGRAIGRFGRGFRGFLGRRWRPIVGIASVLVIAYASTIAWYQYAIHRELKHLRSEGYIVSFKDIKREVPDNDNGAILYTQASKLLPKDNRYEILSLEQKQYCLKGKLRFARPGQPSDVILLSESDLWDVAREELRSSDKALKLTMEASKLPKCCFPLVMQDGLPNLWEQTEIVRKLTQLLCTKALVEAKDGESGEAVRYLKSALKLCNDTTGYNFGIKVVAARHICTTICRVASMCEISEVQAEELSEELALLDPISSYDQEYRMKPAEIVAVYDKPETDSGVLGSKVSMLRARLSGSVLRSELQMLRAVDKAVVFIGKPSRKKRILSYQGMVNFLYEGGEMSGLLGSIILAPPAAPSAFDAYSADNRIKGCRTVLALCAYKKKFGAYPSSLKDLQNVSNCKSITIDRYSGKDMVYRKTGEGFLLYSVGPNRKDDSGAEDPEHKSGLGYNGFSASENYDIVWKLPS